MAEFEAFPKIPRLNRDIVVTEKIDGTNAAVIIEQWNGDPTLRDELVRHQTDSFSVWYHVTAQSRKRLITPTDDNFGFARWVQENKAELVQLMGPGRHFGEWWGSGIQRGYGLPKGEKRFSLFNPTFHFGEVPGGSGLLHNLVDTVPVLYEGPFLERNETNGELPVEAAIWELRNYGSVAAPGFMNPEGVIVWHEAARSMFKVTVLDDEKPKGSTE